MLVLYKINRMQENMNQDYVKTAKILIYQHVKSYFLNIQKERINKYIP